MSKFTFIQPETQERIITNNTPDEDIPTYRIKSNMIDKFDQAQDKDQI